MNAIDIYVLDHNLNVIGIIDAYKSLIWAERYYDLGDCELYCSALPLNIDLLHAGNYLMHGANGSICRIEKIEIDTDAENGDYIIASGKNAQSLLDQRIVWNTMTANGNAEAFIRKMVDGALGSTASAARQIKDSSGNLMFTLGAAAGFSDKMSEQVSYKNIGEKLREYGRRFGWGYRVLYNSGKLEFSLYSGTDRSDSVIFSDEFENLSTSKYVRDESNIGNVAAILGEGQGAERIRMDVGETTGIERHEVYVDARDISKDITFGELKAAYPLIEDGGEGYIGNWAYFLRVLDIEIVSDYQRDWIVSEYHGSGTFVIIDGKEYFEVTDWCIAEWPSDADASNPPDDQSVTIDQLLYISYLLARGENKLAEYGVTTSFEGDVEPNATFVFGRDYFLGDIVTVQNAYGISAQARIVEVVEVYDDSGFSVEPKFEYIQTEA